MKNEQYPADRWFAVILAIILMACFLVSVSGCCSAPPPCPPVTVPDHVTEVIYALPRPISTPVPPKLSIYGVDAEDISQAAAAIEEALQEYRRAYEEAWKIIIDHNKSAGEIAPPP